MNTNKKQNHFILKSWIIITIIILTFHGNQSILAYHSPYLCIDNLLTERDIISEQSIKLFPEKSDSESIRIDFSAKIDTTTDMLQFSKACYHHFKKQSLYSVRSVNQLSSNEKSVFFLSDFSAVLNDNKFFDKS